MLHINIVDIVT